MTEKQITNESTERERNEIFIESQVVREKTFDKTMDRFEKDYGNNSEEIKNLKGNLDKTNAQLSTKASESEVIKKGYGTLNDFNEETRALIQGLSGGETNINAVLGYENVKKMNLSSSAITNDKISGLSLNKIAEVESSTYYYNNFNEHRLTEGLVDENGTEQYYSSGWISDYMQLTPNQRVEIYSHNGTGGILQNVGCIYNESKTFVSEIPKDNFKNGVLKFTMPSNGYFIKLNLVKGIIDRQYVLSLGNAKIKGLKISSENVESFHISKATDLDIEYYYESYEGFNPNTVTAGIYVDDAGELQSFSIYSGGISDYIEVMPTMTCEGYFYSNSTDDALTFFGGFYDKNKNWIAPIPTSSNPIATFTIPDGVYFVRINYSHKRLDDVYLTLTKPYMVFNNVLSSVPMTTPVAKVAFLGDSITYGHGVSENERYSTLTCKELNMQEFNYGISSTKMAQEDSWVGSSFVERYTEIDSSVDLIIVFGGTNDYWNGVAQFGQPNSTNPKEFYGALNNLILGLQGTYKNSELLFITPYNQHYRGGASDVVNSTTNKTLKDYVDAIKERCEFHSVPVLDLFSTSGMNVAHDEGHKWKFTQDGIHPNAVGNKRIAQKLVQFIKNI